MINIKEYLLFSISGINLLPTILLCLVFIYWLLTLLGVFSSDSIDLNFGVDDIDLDLDLDLDADTDVDLASSNIFVKILSYGNFGLVPFMVYFSIYIVSVWAITMLGYYIPINPNSVFGVLFLLVNMLIGFFITKWVTIPLVPFFQGLEIDNKFDPIGKSGILTTALNPERLGTMTIVGNKGQVIILNVVCSQGEYKKGEEMTIVSKDSKREVYNVIPKG